MSAGDDPKTKEQLLAEIEALQAELARRESDSEQPTSAAAPIFATPVTRRESLSGWVAPVILSLPVVQGLGMILNPGTAHAAITKKPTVAKPTAKPTTPPSATPTAAASPTMVGRCIVAPTVAPTLGMGAAPDTRPTEGEFLALGSARIAVRTQIRL